MKKVIKLTENDLEKIVKRVLKEQDEKDETGEPLNKGGDFKICASPMVKGNSNCYSNTKKNHPQVNIRFSKETFGGLMHPGIYWVKEGDSLSRIKEKLRIGGDLKTFVKDMKELNQLKADDDLKPNDILLFNGESY